MAASFHKEISPLRLAPGMPMHNRQEATQTNCWFCKPVPAPSFKTDDRKNRHQKRKILTTMTSLVKQ